MKTIKNKKLYIIIVFSIIFGQLIFAEVKDNNFMDDTTPSIISYTVKGGDSLWGIAKKYESTITAICKLNNVDKNKHLRIGQIIKIPNQAYIEKMNIDQKWDKAIQFRGESNFIDCITLLKEIANYKNNDSLSIGAQYQIADIYLNDIRDYIFAIKEFEYILNKYPDSSYAKKSIFMLGYINANHIQAYSDAIYYYNMFLKKYPSDELSHSVNYELNMLDSLDIINDFNKLNQN